MIELPRAAICADQLAKQAEFFSFGTNDLTQTALGISRDDAATFMRAYEEKGIYALSDLSDAGAARFETADISSGVFELSAS